MSPLEFDLLKALAEHPNRAAVARADPESQPAARLGSVRSQRRPARSCACARRSSRIPSIRGSSGRCATRATSSCRTGREDAMNVALRDPPAPLLRRVRRARRWRSAAACASRRPRCASAPTSGSAASRCTSRASSAASIPRRVQLVEYPSASEVLRAFRNQAIDGMVISLDELFGLAVDGLQPRIILVVDVSHGADVVVGRARDEDDARPQGQVGRRRERRARRIRVEPRARAERHAGERRQRRAPRIERAAGRVREGHGRRRRHVRSVPRAVAAGAAPRRCSTARRFPARSSTCSPCARRSSTSEPKAIQALLAGWFGAIDYIKREPDDAARRMGMRQQTSGEQFLAGAAGAARPDARGEPAHARRAGAGARRRPGAG